jgi:TPP-dependent pyruvate/acetoin dehydrogenase alpha subunit
VVARAELTARHAVTTEQLAELDAAVAGEIDAVCERSLKAPWPSADEVVREFAP